MMPPGARKILLLLLAACFAVQTYLVYSDEPSLVQLEGPALEGAELWHRHNCQACHQLYGYGGFLGPDLTNLAGRLQEPQLTARLTQLMTQGSGAMPPFPVTDTEIAAIQAFLEEMNRSGHGQARQTATAGGQDFLAACEVVIANASPQVQRGFATVTSRPCLSCHQGLVVSAVGAPALASIGTTDTLMEVLEQGKPPRMPPPSPPFSGEERQEVADFLGWLHANADEIAQRTSPPPERTLTWSDLPWWEYP